MKRNKKQYNPGKIQKLWPFLVGLYEKSPEVFRNEGLIKAEVAKVWRALVDPKRCPNCNSSMSVYMFKFDVMDALLLLAMAGEAQKRLERMPFTEANQIKTTQLTASYAVRSRTTQCSKLGLVAKMRGENGRQIPGTWVITTRGWQALAGHPVPSSVHVFRNEIIDRPTDTTTLGKVLSDGGESAGYEPQDWVHIIGSHEGELL